MMTDIFKNFVSPFQGFVGVVDVSTVGCTYGYFCNTPSVLYYGILEPRSGGTIITTCEAGGKQTPHTSKPRSGGTIITTCAAGGNAKPRTHKPRSGDTAITTCAATGKQTLHTSTSHRNDISVGYNIYGSKLMEEGVYLYKINNCDAAVNRGKLIITK